MNALLFSDIHASRTALNQLQIISKSKDIDLILFAGDFVNMGHPLSFGVDFFKIIEESNKKFLWVPGNNDFGDMYDNIIRISPSLEGKLVKHKDCKFSGVGGSPDSWSGRYQGESKLFKKIGGSIFLSHYPPPGVFYWLKKDIDSPAITNSKPAYRPGRQIQNNNDRNSKQFEELENLNLDSVSNLGFRNLHLARKFFLADAPKAHICGHIHNTWGVNYIGDTKVIKLAAFELGHYAIMELNSLKVRFERWR